MGELYETVITQRFFACDSTQRLINDCPYAEEMNEKIKSAQKNKNSFVKSLTIRMQVMAMIVQTTDQCHQLGSDDSH